MDFSRVTSRLLNHRLDAGFYSSDVLKNEAIMRSFGVSRLADRISTKESGYGVLPSSNDYCSEQEGVGLIRGGDLDNGAIDFPSVFAPLKFASKRATVQRGDVLLLIKGACIDQAAGVGLIGKPQNGLIFNGSCYRLRTKDVDSAFLTAYFLTNYFLLQKRRAIANTGIAYNSEEFILDYLIPRVDEKAQAYIGEKVRQAERLRARAWEIQTELQSFFAPLKPNSNQEWELFSRVSNNILTEILTAQTYKAEFLENRQRLSTVYDKLASFTSFFTSIRNGYDERSVCSDGISYLKVADVQANRLNFDSAGKVEVDNWNSATIQQRPEQKDLLLTRKGTFGVAAVVMTKQQFLASSEVFVCKPKDKKSAAALSWFLNSYGGRCQFWQFATGTTMLGINQENLAKILVPVFDDSTNDYFNKANSEFVLLSEMSFALTTAAKYLVEGLIEGKITENELVEAEEALASGEREPDKAILARLTRKGMDAAHEAALFADLDALYSALDETNSVSIFA